MSLSNLHEGKYLVQSGFRKDTALISCPYWPARIEVYDAHSLKILHGADVYWSEVRRHYCTSKNGPKQLIQAVVVGIKHCPYFVDGKSILSTVKVIPHTQGLRIQGIPLDPKLPKFELDDFSFLAASQEELLENKENIEKRYYWSRFLYWNFQEALPRGCLVDTFYGYKTPESETEAILCNMEIDQRKPKLQAPISQAIGSKANQLPINGHKRFSSMVFTIDPPNSIDIEDALSVEPLGKGIYEVGVHISDVTAYKNLINRDEILQRGTSIYLPHKTIHMMPEEIIDMCALKSHEDRLAFSILVRMNEEGEILDSRYEKTIVNSCARLSYEEAQQILENKIENREQFVSRKGMKFKELNEVTKKIKLLRSIALQKRNSRVNASVFDKSEMSFKLDEKNYPINIGVKTRLDSEKLVEEFMIMANYEVAKRLVRDFGEHSLLIYHPKPSSCNIEHLSDMASDLGFRFKACNIQNLEQQISELISRGIKDEAKQLLLLRAIHIQEFAHYKRYLNTFNGHYGLNLECYTHFTSPLRRFADFMVHEQLEKCLNKETLSRKEIDSLIQEVEMINEARVRGKKLKQKVFQSFVNLYLYKREEKTMTKGFILSLGLKSVTVYVPIYNIIKEVFWEQKVEYGQKGSVQIVVYQQGEEKKLRLQKNDSIDIRVQNGIHQEAKVSLNLQLGSSEVK